MIKIYEVMAFNLVVKSLLLLPFVGDARWENHKKHNGLIPIWIVLRRF